jgi:hypothetical protein
MEHNVVRAKASMLEDLCELAKRVVFSPEIYSLPFVLGLSRTNQRRTPPLPHSEKSESLVARQLT